MRDPAFVVCQVEDLISQVRAQRALERISQEGGRVLWLSDQERRFNTHKAQDVLHWADSGLTTPDLYLDLKRLPRTDIALILTDLAQRQIASLILLEGSSLTLHQDLPRLRWIYARFQVDFILIGDLQT